MGAELRGAVPCGDRSSKQEQKGRGGTHTKQVSVFKGTNEFYEIISDADCRCARYIQDMRRPIKNASTCIQQASHQSADRTRGRHPHWLWVSIANPGTKPESAKSNSSSYFYCLKRNIINSTTQQK